jgi:hypothetical protein
MKVESHYKNDMPLYASKRTLKSLGQQYRIYHDRVELQSWFLFHTVVVPRDEVRAVEVRPSAWTGKKGFTWGIKLDNCDLFRHVLLTKKCGIFKCMGFTPDPTGEQSSFARDESRRLPKNPAVSTKAASI